MSIVVWRLPFLCFNDTANTEIYTLSLHDALPISNFGLEEDCHVPIIQGKEILYLEKARHPFIPKEKVVPLTFEDRKSTRLNSSHANISYAVFCLKKTDTQSSGKQACVPRLSPSFT